MCWHASFVAKHEGEESCDNEWWKVFVSDERDALTFACHSVVFRQPLIVERKTQNTSIAWEIIYTTDANFHFPEQTQIEFYFRNMFALTTDLLIILQFFLLNIDIVGAKYHYLLVYDEFCIYWMAKLLAKAHVFKFYKKNCFCNNLVKMWFIIHIRVECIHERRASKHNKAFAVANMKHTCSCSFCRKMY